MVNLFKNKENENLDLLINSIFELKDVKNKP